jgi:cytoskeletal protein RodZ
MPDVRGPARPLAFADLRKRREASGITLPAIANSTKVPLTLLSDLERGDLSKWPRGFYARAHLSAYARAARIPVEDVLGLVLEKVMPEPVENPEEQAQAWPAAYGARPGSSLVTPAVFVVVTLATFVLGAPVVRYLRHAPAAPVEFVDRTPAKPSAPPQPGNPAITPRPQDDPPRSTADAPRAAPPSAPSGARSVATAGSTPAPAVRDPGTREAAVVKTLSPALATKLVAERTELASSLDAAKKSIVEARQEQQEVEALLANAQSEEDAAAFRKRLDEIAGHLATLAKSEQRLSAGIRAIDRRLKSGG